MWKETFFSLQPVVVGNKYLTSGIKPGVKAWREIQGCYKVQLPSRITADYHEELSSGFIFPEELLKLSILYYYYGAMQDTFLVPYVEID